MPPPRSIPDNSVSDVDEDNNEAQTLTGNGSSTQARREIKFGEIHLTSKTHTQNVGLNTLYCGHHGLVRDNNPLHFDTWDTVLCEGVPVSIRELVSLTLVQLGLSEGTNRNTTILW